MEEKNPSGNVNPPIERVDAVKSNENTLDFMMFYLYNSSINSLYYVL